MGMFGGMFGGSSAAAAAPQQQPMQQGGNMQGGGAQGGQSPMQAPAAYPNQQQQQGMGQQQQMGQQQPMGQQNFGGQQGFGGQPNMQGQSSQEQHQSVLDQLTQMMYTNDSSNSSASKGPLEPPRLNLTNEQIGNAAHQVNFVQGDVVQKLQQALQDGDTEAFGAVLNSAFQNVYSSALSGSVQLINNVNDKMLTYNQDSIRDTTTSMLRESELKNSMSNTEQHRFTQEMASGLAQRIAANNPNLTSSEVANLANNGMSELAANILGVDADTLNKARSIKQQEQSKQAQVSYDWDSVLANGR